MVDYCTVMTKIGPITLGGTADFLHQVYLPSAGFKTEIQASTPLLSLAKEELFAYLDGDLKEFSTPLWIKGSHFQENVWRALTKIPYGETVTYGALCALVEEGSPRSLGTACGKNPLCIFLPCHRVLRKGGGLGGYSGGLDIKAHLLAMEQEYK